MTLRTTIPTIIVLTGAFGPMKAATIFELASTHDKGPGQATALLDIDGDGDLDFFSANKGTINYARNDGACVFAHAQTIQVDNSNGFGMHDLNGDGKMDFTVAQQGGANDLDSRINAGNGNFTPTNLGNESVGCVRNVVFADFDLDGHTDSYHSASAFGTNHEGNQFHPGLSNGRFGPDIIRRILNPPVPKFWYDTANHPTYGKVEWSNKQSKSAIARDLDGDGKLDVIVSDGTVGGYEGTNTTMIYKNKSPGTSRWIALDIRSAGTWAIGARVTAYKAGTQTIAGLDEVRTDFCYRSKRHPVLHFGLGAATAIDAMIRTWDGKAYQVTGLQAGGVRTVNLDQLTPTTTARAPILGAGKSARQPAAMSRFDLRGRSIDIDKLHRPPRDGILIVQTDRQVYREIR